jgi:hypothetical protein
MDHSDEAIEFGCLEMVYGRLECSARDSAHCDMVVLMLSVVLITQYRCAKTIAHPIRARHSHTITG